MWKYVLGVTLLGAAVAATAQYTPRNPDDWLERMIGRSDNPPMTCDIQRRINRDGDIVWMQMTCRAFRGRG